MDFSTLTAASDAAKSQLASSAEVTPSTPTPTPVVTPAASPASSVTPTTPDQVAVTPTPIAATPATLSPAEQKLIEIDLGNGQVAKFTRDQLANGHFDGLRQADYTKKTQEVANQRKELETYAQQLQTAQQEILSARQQLEQQYNQFRSGQPQQPLLPQQQPAGFDPAQPVSMGQLYQVAQAMIQRQQQTPAVSPQQIESFAQKIVEDRLQIADYAEKINNTLGEVYKSNPILKSVPEVEDIIRFRVAQMQPESLEAAQKAFQDVAAELAHNFSAPFQQQQQQQVAQKAQLASGGIEPPGGSAVQPAATSFKLPNKIGIDWDKMKIAAAGMVRGQ